MIVVTMRSLQPRLHRVGDVLGDVMILLMNKVCRSNLSCVRFAHPYPPRPIPFSPAAAIITAMQAMFDPPAPLEFKKGISKRKPPQVEGVAALLAKDKGLFEKGSPPPKEKFETPRQRHARIAAAKKKVCNPVMRVFLYLSTTHDVTQEFTNWYMMREVSIEVINYFFVLYRNRNVVCVIVVEGCTVSCRCALSWGEATSGEVMIRNLNC